VHNKTYRISKQALIDFCVAVCQKAGFSKEDAEITADVLVATDMMGTNSHGTKNLRMYIKKLKAGGIEAKALPKVIAQDEAWALLDGQAGIGMVVAYKAMKLAIEKAKKSGIAMVGVRNSTHFGAAGFYSAMAAKEGMAGIVMGNTEPNMAVPGGKGRYIGNSPFSYAFPTKDGDPVLLDIALSETAALKVIKAADMGQEIPPTWIVDENGDPSKNSNDFYKGALAPMAAHKGYGLSIMVELFTGLLMGGCISDEITSWVWDLPTPNRVSQTFIVVDISKFISMNAYGKRIEKYKNGIVNSPRHDGVERIYMPGEIEFTKAKKACAEGIFLPADVAESLIALSEDFKIALDFE